MGETRNKVFIATSLDGFIADRNGKLDWLNLVKPDEDNDMGYGAFLKSVDAIIMGRKSFETVCGFDIEWPYSIPVFVLSNTLKIIPKNLEGRVEVIKGELKQLLTALYNRGFKSLYIDGGKTIQSFLKEDLLDELTVTTIPIILGGGSPLFSETPGELEFEHVKTEVFSGKVVQSTYKRKR